MSFKKISKGAIKGLLSEEILGLLPSTFYKDPVLYIQTMGGEVIKDSRRRWAAIFTLQNGEKIFLKRDQTKGWIESLKYFFLPSKGRREWFITYQIQKRNLNIPKPLGWMERVHWGLVNESYYLSEAVGSGVSILEDPKKLGEEFYIDILAKTVRKIHVAGLLHKDFHAGNVLWSGRSLFLTDLHRARVIRALSLNQRLWNLSHLFHSLRSTWGEQDQIQFINKYFEKEPVYFQKREECLRKIHIWMDRLQKRQWRSRTRRCLKESTNFSIKKGDGINYYHRRDFSLDQLKKVLEEHDHVVKEKPSALVKNSPEVKVSIMNEGENKVCVKQVRYPHFLDILKNYFRRSKGLKAWVAGNGLNTRGIPSLKPLALMERRDWLGLRESFFLVETLENSQELDRYICDGFENFKKKRLFIKAFARWFSYFHKKDLYHKDMKTCNVLVSENGEDWDFRLLDLEDIRLDEKVNEKKIFRNFLQLNTSTPKIITRADRFRFFREYLRLNPIIKNRKVFLRRLIEESKRRGFVYVTSQGVVEGEL